MPTFHSRFSPSTTILSTLCVLGALLPPALAHAASKPTATPGSGPAATTSIPTLAVTSSGRVTAVPAGTGTPQGAGTPVITTTATGTSAQTITVTPPGTGTTLPAPTQVQPTVTATAPPTSTPVLPPTATPTLPPTPTPTPNPLYHSDLWLHATGTQLYTNWNAPVTLKSLNWYGFEYAPFVPDGLNKAPLDQILYTIRSLGFNALRITFADETVHRNPVVNKGLNANPQFRGMHALDLMEVILQHAHKFGIRVVLCNSRSEAGRGPESATGLWYTKQYPASVWTADWEYLVRRFRTISSFVGADLRNEPHIPGSGREDINGYIHNGPQWGPVHGVTNPAIDWRYAAQTLGNQLLAINPHMLIIVEGVQIYYLQSKNKLIGGLWGSNLIGVPYAPIQLRYHSQLVYSVHEYGPMMWQGNWFNPHTTYASLEARWNHFWGYLLTAQNSLRAPIYVGEFGTCHDFWNCISSNDGWKQGFWWQSFIRYMHEHPQISWAYWALNPMGPFVAKEQNFYSLFSTDWRHYYPLLIRGLGPLLSEPDGAQPVNSYGLHAFPMVPGCSPNGSCVAADSHKPHTVSVIRNLPYVRPANPAQSGDLYLPNISTGKRPAVVIVHPGNWNSGVKGGPDSSLLTNTLTQQGYVVYDINYRLNSNGGQYPHNIQDVEDALAFLTVHAAQYRIDSTRLGIVGVSAGGYLAMMAGYRAGIQPFAPPHYPGIKPHVEVVGSLFSPVELWASVAAASHTDTVRALAGYFGGTYAQKPAIYRDASPLRYTDTAVPTIFWYGTKDPLTPLAQTYELFKRLRQRSVYAKLVDLPGSPRTIAELSASEKAYVLGALVGFVKSAFTKGT